MAASVGAVERLGIGGPGGNFLYAEITLDSSYAAAGESITAAQFGLAVIKTIFVGSAKGGELIDMRRSSDTTWLVKVWSVGGPNTSNSASVERAPTFDLSTVVIPVLVRGY